ncbi:MAG: response regulator transcription factor, partial [Rikenellaceae bacterium]
MSYRILVVDDEDDILEFQSYNLKAQGWEVATARSGMEAISQAKTFMPDLILLDVMMPEMDGITACREIRRLPQMGSVIIAMLTARSEDYSQIAGFDAGADDYISKPIRPAVLISRINALLKRRSAALQSGDGAQEQELHIRIDFDRHLVFVQGREISLPRKEFSLLKLLLSKPGKVFT